MMADPVTRYWPLPHSYFLLPHPAAEAINEFFLQRFGESYRECEDFLNLRCGLKAV